jgi:hypothetical protein
VVVRVVVGELALVHMPVAVDLVGVLVPVFVLGVGVLVGGVGVRVRLVAMRMLVGVGLLGHRCSSRRSTGWGGGS